MRSKPRKPYSYGIRTETRPLLPIVNKDVAIPFKRK